MGKLKAYRIEDEISKLYVELDKHQKKCKHIKATKIYKANTGNYDPHNDCYWISVHCPTCLKKWMLDGDDPEYRGNKFRTVKSHNE